ncbi:hypothetical protein OS914_02500 [Arthrobacter sp. H14-L1]|nr:hypothetical protein [Arthrobacter sp. H14-L1]
MDHKLGVTVRMTIAPPAVTIDVRGCLTLSGVNALLPIVRRAGRIIDGPEITVDISAAQHIDTPALKYLTFLATGLGSEPFTVLAPDLAPTWPYAAQLLSYGSAA